MKENNEVVDAKSQEKYKKKIKKNIPIGGVHIQSSFNNTIITITDPRGNVVSWASGGCGI
jgi:small subunit ribosomal protein S11